ncbi:MAG: hypothetical protein ABJA82_08270 [Myxococcales bacterium]
MTDIVATGGDPAIAAGPVALAAATAADGCDTAAGCLAGNTDGDGKLASGRDGEGVIGSEVGWPWDPSPRCPAAASLPCGIVGGDTGEKNSGVGRDNETWSPRSGVGTGP